MRRVQVFSICDESSCFKLDYYDAYSFIGKASGCNVWKRWLGSMLSFVKLCSGKIYIVFFDLEKSFKIIYR